VVSAARHWLALDGTFSRLLPAAGSRHAHERLAHRAAALSDIYLARMLNTIAQPAVNGTNLLQQIDELRLTHRALTEALAGAYTGDRDQRAPTAEAD
jgi:hypothetical protein